MEEQDFTNLCEWAARTRGELARERERADRLQEQLVQLARELERAREAHRHADGVARDARRTAEILARTAENYKRATKAAHRHAGWERERADYVRALLNNVRSIVGPDVMWQATLITPEHAALIPEEDEN